MKYVIGMVLILFVPLAVWGVFQSDWTGASTRAQAEARAQVAVAQAEARAAVEVAAYNAQAQSAQAQAQAQAQIAQSASMAVVFPLVSMTVVVGLLGGLSIALIAVLVIARTPTRQDAAQAKIQSLDIRYYE